MKEKHTFILEVAQSLYRSIQEYSDEVKIFQTELEQNEQLLSKNREKNCSRQIMIKNTEQKLSQKLEEQNKIIADELLLLNQIKGEILNLKKESEVLQKENDEYESYLTQKEQSLLMQDSDEVSKSQNLNGELERINTEFITIIEKIKEAEMNNFKVITDLEAHLKQLDDK